jgi:hypothetical protein
MRIWGHGPWDSAPGRERRSVCLAGLGRLCGLCQVAVAGWVYSYMAGVEDADVWWWSGSGSGCREWCILRRMVPTSIVIILIVDHLALRVFPSFSLFQHRRYHLFYSSITCYTHPASPRTPTSSIDILTPKTVLRVQVIRNDPSIPSVRCLSRTTEKSKGVSFSKYSLAISKGYPHSLRLSYHSTF